MAITVLDVLAGSEILSCVVRYFLLCFFERGCEYWKYTDYNHWIYILSGFNFNIIPISVISDRSSRLEIKDAFAYVSALMEESLQKKSCKYFMRRINRKIRWR